MVDTSHPSFAASTACIGWRIDAASTCASRSGPSASTISPTTASESIEMSSRRPMKHETELARGGEPLRGERDLHDHAVVESGQRTTLGDHLAGVLRDDLSRDRSVHQLADAPDALARLAVLLREQRRIGGRAGQHAPGRDLLDLGYGSCVDEQLHWTSWTASSTSCMSCASVSSTFSLSMTATPSERARSQRWSWSRRMSSKLAR